MKRILLSLIVTLLLGGGQFAYGQSGENMVVHQDANMEFFHLVIGPSQTTHHLLIEGTGLTNELGERVVELGANPKAILLQRLENIKTDPRVTSYAYSATKNELKISMGSLSAEQVFGVIQTRLQTASTN